MSRALNRVPCWASYDDAVVPYEPYHVDKGYALLARDIALMLGPRDGTTVLDVGTGTGEAALAVLCRAGTSIVVCVDPSLPMRRRAVRKGLTLTVTGEAPGLPSNPSVSIS
jgi:predicted RNA methylase